MESYNDEEVSIEQLQGRLNHVKKRLSEATTEFDLMYWSWRVRDLGEELDALKQKKGV